jgi:hypothetical protein
MSLNRTAKGIVLVPALLLGAAFLSAAVWGEATDSRPLALGLGLALIGAGLLAQLLPETVDQPDQESKAEPRRPQ